MLSPTVYSYGLNILFPDASLHRHGKSKVSLQWQESTLRAGRSAVGLGSLSGAAEEEEVVVAADGFRKTPWFHRFGSEAGFGFATAGSFKMLESSEAFLARVEFVTSAGSRGASLSIRMMSLFMLEMFFVSTLPET